jgi:hypothetical protein
MRFLLVVVTLCAAVAIQSEDASVLDAGDVKPKRKPRRARGAVSPSAGGSPPTLARSSGSGATPTTSSGDISCTAQDPASQRQTQHYKAICRARAWGDKLQSIYKTKYLQDIYSKRPSAETLAEVGKVAVKLIAGSLLGVEDPVDTLIKKLPSIPVPVPEGFAEFVSDAKLQKAVAGIAEAQQEALADKIQGTVTDLATKDDENFVRNHLILSLISLRYLHVRAALVSVWESPILLADEAKRKKLSDVLGKFPASAKTLRNAAKHISEKQWSRMRTAMRTVLCVGIDAALKAGTSGLVAGLVSGLDLSLKVRFVGALHLLVAASNPTTSPADYRRTVDKRIRS